MQGAGRGAALAAMLMCGTAAAAQDVTVHVQNLRNEQGSVLVAICTAETFLGRDCGYRARGKARARMADVTIVGVPPGAYAVQAIHDENDNSELDRNLIGMPREGFCFSRDAPMRMGPPRFSDAAVEIGEGGGSVTSLTLSMHYF